MLEFRYDTQLLIDGDDLDEDEVFDYISPGSFWNTELLSARSMTSSWRTWTDRAEA